MDKQIHIEFNLNRGLLGVIILGIVMLFLVGGILFWNILSHSSKSEINSLGLNDNRDNTNNFNERLTGKVLTNLESSGNLPGEISIEQPQESLNDKISSAISLIDSDVFFLEKKVVECTDFIPKEYEIINGDIYLNNETYVDRDNYRKELRDYLASSFSEQLLVCLTKNNK